MPAFNGKDMLLKIGNGASPEVFTTVSALKTLSTTLDRNQVDVTTKDSAGWRENLGTAAIASVSASASGVWTDTATQDLVRQLGDSGAFANFQILYGSGDKLTFKGTITNFQRSGGFDDAQNYSFTVQSSGVVTTVLGS